MFQPQENHHFVPATNPSNFVYIPVPVPVPVPVHVHPEHFPVQMPNFYPQPLSFEMNKQGSFMPSFQAPHYDEQGVANTEMMLADGWARPDLNPGGREVLEQGAASPHKPAGLTETGSSPEPESPPEALAEMEQVLVRTQNSNKITSPVEHVSLPWAMCPFKPASSPWAMFPFEPVSSPWTTFPFEPVSPAWTVPAFKRAPPPKAFTKAEQKLEVQLFVGGLDFSIDKQQLYKEFLPFGDLISAKVIMKNGRSKGYGFVVYSNPVDAETAIREMNGKTVGKKQLFVALSKGKEESGQHQSPTEQKIKSGVGSAEQTQG